VVVGGAAKVSWSGREFTFLAARFWLACLVYVAVLAVCRPKTRAGFGLAPWTIAYAILVGVILALGYGLQTWYLKENSAVSAAFLTSTTVLWAPLIAFLFRQRVYATTLVGALLATIGVAYMSFASAEGGSFNWHDLLKNWQAIFAAIAFAVEILLVSKFAPKEGSIQWTLISCLTVAVLMTSLSLGRQQFSWPTEYFGWSVFAVLFTGTFATAVALGLQNWAQAQEHDGRKIIDGPRAAIISTLEPVFTTLLVGSFLLLGFSGSAQELAGLPGCFLILLGTVISEVASAKRAQRSQPSPEVGSLEIQSV
jgi:drug/metabolite transporter (DMT)-like permease